MSEGVIDRAPPGGVGADVRSRRLSALAESNFEAMTTSEVLERVTELATELVPASLGASAAVVEGEDSFRVVASTVPGQVVGHDTKLRSHGGVTRFICETLKTVVVPDIAVDPIGIGDLARLHGVGAYLGVPIASEDRCLGVLYVLDEGPRAYDDDDVAFVNLLAGRAAAAVRHADVFAEMRAARERSEALAWIANAVIAAAGLEEVLESVVEGVAAAVAADDVRIVTIEGSRVMSHARSGGRDPGEIPIDDVTRAVLGEGRLVLAPDGFHPRVVAPLRVGTTVMGALDVSRRLVRFDEAEIDLIVAMANQVAIAIDNVRLLDTTRSALRETEAMYEMVQALVAGADLPEMLQAVVQGTIDAVPAAGARVAMANDREVTAQAVAGIAPEASFDEITEGRAGQVLRTATPVHDAHYLATPLMVHQRMLGVLEAMGRGEDHDFTIHQLGTLQAAAAQAAVAIENHLLFGEVQRLAITDELTGVNSRRHLFELGQREYAQSVRFRKPLSAIMFDLDHFKEINDTLGHLVGDEVLAGVADRCRRVLREVDILGRYGGEEFAVILPDAKATDAITVAERVRRAIAADPVETARGPVAVTVSVGVAEVGPGILDLKTLLDRADAAMYAAKEAGRDQVKAA